MRSKIALTVIALAILVLWAVLDRGASMTVHEDHFSDPEQWAAATTATGEGLIRHAAPQVPSDADPNAALGGTQDLTVASLGPLSPHGVRIFSAMCEKQIADANRRIDQSLMPSSRSGASVALSQYEALKNIYLYKSVQELLSAGSYISFPVEGSPPQRPSGCAYVQHSPLPLENGTMANVVVWVDVKRRRELGEVYDMLKETRAAARWERLRDWNNRPEADRRAEIDDYLSLSSKAMGDPTKNLTADEFARYWRLHAILLELDAEAIHGRTMLFERQGSGRR